jgi:hypothetical protein
VKFNDLIDKKVSMIISMIAERELQDVIIRGVDYGGLWIEHEPYTQSLLAGMNLPAGRTPLLFVPYHGIKYAVLPTDKISLSEKAFGV